MPATGISNAPAGAEFVACASEAEGVGGACAGNPLGVVGEGVLPGEDAAASADGEAAGAGVPSVAGATDGDADATALSFALLAGLDCSLVAGGVVIGVTGVAGGDLLVRYQTSADKPRRIDAASSKTRARGLKAID